jgi:hypothetical protein
MRNLIEESKVKSETLFRGGVAEFNKVIVKFEKGGRDYIYEIYRSSFKGGSHHICCTSFEHGLYDYAQERSKVYSDNAKFEAAIKRIQSKIS